jgi:hypothetical protein
VLFGGFNDGALDRVWTFKVTPGQAEGEITASSVKLADKDFFATNGIILKYQGEHNEGRREFIVTGHNFIHGFDADKRQWRILPTHG